MVAVFSVKIFRQNATLSPIHFRIQLSDFILLPVIWSEENQLTSDSMAVFTKNRQTDRLELYNSAFIVSQVDTIRFNQIKGRSLTGYFKNNELYKIDIKGKRRINLLSP